MVFLAQALEAAGAEVSVLDMNLGYTVKELTSRIGRFRPDIIGFTAMTLGYKAFYGMVNEIKRGYPAIKIALGGAHLSALREKVLEDCPGIDYGIFLEGDLSMCQLCQGENPEKIQGLIYRDNGKIVTNGFRNFIDDLDKIPFPKYRAFELQKYPLRQIAIVTSRGCPYDCIYCSTDASIGKKFRARSAQSILSEVEYWYGLGYREIMILDDNFTMIYERVKDFCALLGKNNFDGLRFNLTSGVRADRVDRELLLAMKGAGVKYLAFGVEAASDRVLKNIRKGEPIAVIEKSIREACEAGFIVDLFFLVGSPGETIDDLRLSFSLAKRYPVRRAMFYNLLPLPSTVLLSWLEEKKYLVRPLEDILNNTSYYKNQPCFVTPEMPLLARRSAFKQAQRVSLQVRRKFVEQGLNGPVYFKKFCSFIYTMPLVEDIVNNNRFMLLAKEKLKKTCLGRR